jgi:hypothetical protein
MSRILNGEEIEEPEPGPLPPTGGIMSRILNG